MDADNSTTDFGDEFHPAYPCVPTLAMRKPATRMRECACRGRTEEMISLIENDGASVDEADEVGHYAAIHWAALMGFPQTLQAILAQGANVAAVTRHHRTALHYAAQQGHMECVDMLLAAEVPLNVRDKGGKTAELLAMKCGQEKAADAIKAASATAAAAKRQSTARDSEGMASVSAVLQATSLAADTPSVV